MLTCGLCWVDPNAICSREIVIHRKERAVGSPLVMMALVAGGTLNYKEIVVEMSKYRQRVLAAYLLRGELEYSCERCVLWHAESAGRIAHLERGAWPAIRFLPVVYSTHTL